MYDLGRFEPRRRGKPLSQPPGRLTAPLNRGAEPRGGRGRLHAAVCQAVLVVGFVLALLLFLGMMGPEEAPLPGERVGEDVATFYAAEEYDRLMECWGDPGAAQRGAEQVYWEVLSGWNAS